MANRIGKYKVSKKEAALSLADGGEIKGDIQMSGKLSANNATTSFGNKKIMNFGASLADTNGTAVTYSSNDILVEPAYILSRAPAKTLPSSSIIPEYLEAPKSVPTIPGPSLLLKFLSKPEIVKLPTPV